MAIQTTGQQQHIEIREMSRGMEQIFQGLSRMLNDTGSLIQYLLIGYYYNRIPRYSLLEYLRIYLKSSWLKTVTELAKLVAENAIFRINDGAKDIIIPYSVLGEEILMILDVIQVYEQKEGVTIDEVTTVSQFDSYYSNFSTFISQYTANARSTLRTRAPVSSQAVINRFIELGMINDSYQQQKAPRKREISMEDDTSSEESVEELDVDENGEPIQKSLVETLASNVKKAIKKGKKSKHARTVNKKEMKKEEKEEKAKTLRKRREIAKKKKESDEPLPPPVPETAEPVAAPVNQPNRGQLRFQELYDFVMELKPVIEDLQVKFPQINWLPITDKDIEAIVTENLPEIGKRLIEGTMPEEGLQPFIIDKYKSGWCRIGDEPYHIVRTNLKSATGKDMYYVIAKGLPKK